MPRGDRTGPEGEGPRTGRGMGYCAGYDAPGCVTPGLGMGRGRMRGYGGAWGRGRGWRHGFRATGVPRWAWFAPPDWGPPPQEYVERQEVAHLEAQAGWLRQQLDAIQARMDELTKAREADTEA